MSKYMYLCAGAYEKIIYLAVEALKKFFDFFRGMYRENCKCGVKYPNGEPHVYDLAS
jgi:hypothetical protein